MRRSLLLICSLIAFSGFAQQWQALYDLTYIPPQPNPLYSFLLGDQKLSFKINPYDSSIWMARGRFILQFDSNGDFHYYDDSDNPDFDNFANFNNVTFTSNSVYASNDFYGLYKFDGNIWSSASVVGDGMHLTADADTVWMMRSGGSGNSNFLKVSEGSQSFGSTTFWRFAAKNGDYWASAGSVLCKYYQNGAYPIYYADTIPFLLDNSCYDLKFSPNDNRFYTCGDNGISIAIGENFVDTITPYNTIGMPHAPVIEIEFDSQDNIWAMFGDGTTVTSSPNAVSFGYLDRFTMEWTIYDTTNSNVSIHSSIEVDPCDNLWLSTTDVLYILKVGSCEADWLSTLETDLIEFSVYPNPSEGTLNIALPENVAVDRIQVLDLSGRALQSMNYANSIGLDLPTGTYLIQLLNDGKLVGTQKVLLR